MRVFYMLIGLICLWGFLGFTGCSAGGEDDDCGNGTCDSDEDNVSCPQDCTEQDCGNNKIDNNEQCDGTNINGKQCIDIGNYTGGTLACGTDCTFDTTQCTVPVNCGNGLVNQGEDCDGSNLNGNGCTDVGNYTGGTLTCNDDCTYDTAQCTVDEDCGNGNIDDNEECDGNNLNGNDCTDVGNYTGGTLNCNNDCTFNEDECTVDEDCGNGNIDDNEECDGNNLNGNDCTDVGDYTGGTLSCNDDCSFNESQCTSEPECSNGIKEEGEDCDGNDLGEATCESVDDRFVGGNLLCDNACQYDTSECLTELGNIGDPCTDDIQCSSGICLEEILTGLPGGFCVDLCDEYALCEDENAQCLTVGESEFCVSSCDPYDQESCRAGYECIPIDNFVGGCWGNCSDNDQCTTTGFCNTTDYDTNVCTCPEGQHLDRQNEVCAYDTCEYLNCSSQNMGCNPTGGCNGQCALCEGCTDQNYIETASHCFPADAKWGGPCTKDADCPGTGRPGIEVFCDQSTGGVCREVDGPDFVNEGEPCKLSDTADDPDSIAIKLWSGYTIRECFMNCENDLNCRPGYYCVEGLGSNSMYNACMAIDDCGGMGCNADDSYYCADSGACWIDSCNPNPCEHLANSTGTCEKVYDDYACECDNGNFWNPDTLECGLFECEAVDLGTFSGSDIVETSQDSCSNGTNYYSPARLGCARFEQKGREIAYQVVIPVGETVQITVTPTSDFDVSLYVITDCADTEAETCLDGMGSDESPSGSPEAVIITNSGNSDTTYFVLVDSYEIQGCGTFDVSIIQ